jgi:dienelactone hydrolase
MSSLDFIDPTDATVRRAVQHQKRDVAKVGPTGFCMGGAVAWGRATAFFDGLLGWAV